MASEDEYQQRQFWGEYDYVIRAYVVEQEMSGFKKRSLLAYEECQKALVNSKKKSKQ
jgi:hypothetical protein